MQKTEEGEFARISSDCLSEIMGGLSRTTLEAMHVCHNVHEDPGITLFVRPQGFAAADKWVRLGDVDLIFSKGS